MKSAFPEVTVDLLTTRRAIFGALAILILAIAVWMLLQIYWTDGLSALEIAMLLLFVPLFSQIAVGFTLAFVGFVQELRGGDPVRIGRLAETAPDAALAPTAVVMPVFNEDVDRVFNGVESMWRSLSKTGEGRHFDFFILSDSNEPANWLAEECAWLDLCRRFDAFGRIFYRKRRVSIHGKSGNVADFCRRWGKRYRYMIVLDADSVMTGQTMARLVRTMQLRPEAGIVQTLPIMVLGTSPFRLMLQFGARLCSRIFAAGLNYWQLPGGSYWGHNAIVRLAPFIEHCDLPELPKREWAKRHILSHDIIEAALMRKAGYEVWLAYDETGSYEEGPPTLGEMLQRDRRWCQGNLQHFWFLFARGISFTNRLHIWFGIMAYLSAPLWLASLALSSVDAFYRQRYATFSALSLDGTDGMPVAPVHLLIGLTVLLLFAPKALGFLTSLLHVHSYGGAIRLAIGTVLESLFSILLAPVLMLFHSLFVILSLGGWQVRWTTQQRTGGAGTPFAVCLRRYGAVSLLGVVGAWAAYAYLPDFMAWFSPIFGGWMLAVPLAWLTSRATLARFIFRSGLFRTPEEDNPPPELQDLYRPRFTEALPTGTGSAETSLERVLVDPYLNAIHTSLLRQRKAEPDPGEGGMGPLCDRVLESGVASLDPTERMRLLWSAEALQQLHRTIWTSRGETAVPVPSVRPEATGDGV